MQKIHGAPPPPPEEHHETIEDIQRIIQVMQVQSYDLEGLAQDNAVVTRSNSAVLAQLAQITVTMNAIQAQLKKLASAQTNQSRSKVITTAGVAVAISLTGAKPAHQIKQETKMKCTKRKGWVAVKRDVNDG